MLRKALLVCGIVSSFLYVGMNVFVPMRWPAYSSASQTVSELSAIGAPTRSIWVPLGIAYAMLMAAFGWGVRASAGRNRRVRVVGSLLVVYGNERSVRTIRFEPTPSASPDAPVSGTRRMTSFGHAPRSPNSYFAAACFAMTSALILA